LFEQVLSSGEVVSLSHLHSQVVVVEVVTDVLNNVLLIDKEVGDTTGLINSQQSTLSPLVLDRGEHGVSGGLLSEDALA